MNKVHDLRAYLLKRVPDLGHSPERLLTFIENGKIETWQGGNLSHRLTMPLRVIITDFKGSADSLIIPIIEWLQVREPGFDPASTLSFESEIIDSETSDIMLSIQISERVIVKDKAGGGYDIEHVLPAIPWQMNPDAELEIDATDNRG